ncbi:MAG: hypothetical protein WBP81_11610 [Solirubrobacteraceae bacterium]
MNRTTGISRAFANRLISSTQPRPIFPSIAGDDRPASTVVEEPDQLTVALQPRDIPGEEDPIDGTHLERHVL